MFQLRMEITLQLHFVVLVIVMYFFLSCHIYVIYLFVAVTFFDDVRITLYLGTFKLRTEITLLNGHF